MKVFKNHAI